MIYLFKNLKAYKLKAKSYKLNAGMSYIELIVVLSIFSILSSVVIFNYGDFQAKVDIKNLASDIALQVVTAQKSSLSGLLPTLSGYGANWKPSYGVYFDMTTPKQFIYFTDLNNDKIYNETPLDTILITKNSSISRLDACYASPCVPTPLTDLTVTFSRPDSGAVIKSSTPFTVPVSYIQITILSPKGPTGKILLYPSGRIQVN